MKLKFINFAIILTTAFISINAFGTDCYDLNISRESVFTNDIKSGERDIYYSGSYPKCSYRSYCYCKAGYYAKNAGIANTLCTCEVCPQNTYRAGNLLSSASSCTACPSGMYTRGTGVANRNSIEAYKCYSYGYYYNTSTKSCVRCPAGAKNIYGSSVYGTTQKQTSYPYGTHNISECIMPDTSIYKGEGGTYTIPANCYAM